MTGRPARPPAAAVRAAWALSADAHRASLHSRLALDVGDVRLARQQARHAAEHTSRLLQSLDRLCEPQTGG